MTYIIRTFYIPVLDQLKYELSIGKHGLSKKVNVFTDWVNWDFI